MEAQYVYIGLAAAFGLFMAWGIGANDVANAMATSVGSNALTIKQAIIVAAIFEFAGAVLAGGEVTSTIRKGIVDASSLEGQEVLLIYGMLAALLAAGTWLLIASKKRLACFNNAFDCWRNCWFRRSRHWRRGCAVGEGWHNRDELGHLTFDRWVYRLPDLHECAEAHLASG